MFGGFGAGRYLAQRHKAAKAEHLAVTHDEFVRLFVEAGGTPEKAASVVKIMKIMGSAVLVGDKMLTIKE